MLCLAIMKVQLLWKAGLVCHSTCQLGRWCAAFDTGHAGLPLQAAWRGYAARKQYEQMRRQQGALVIQSNWRCSVKRSEFTALREAAVVLQGAWRWVACQTMAPM